MVIERQHCEHIAVPLRDTTSTRGGDHYEQLAQALERRVERESALPDDSAPTNLIHLALEGFGKGETLLFPGSEQDDRYSRHLQTMFDIPEVTKKADDLGINSEDIGSHSNRKGAGTYLSSGTTAGPSTVPIHLRLGWILQGVSAKYLMYDDSGDQFVGRTVCGLPPFDARFGDLPPFFKERTLVVDEALQACFPGAPKELSSVLEFCLNRAQVAHALGHRVRL